MTSRRLVCEWTHRLHILSSFFYQKALKWNKNFLIQYKDCFWSPRPPAWKTSRRRMSSYLIKASDWTLPGPASYTARKSACAGVNAIKPVQCAKKIRVVKLALLSLSDRLPPSQARPPAYCVPGTVISPWCPVWPVSGQAWGVRDVSMSGRRKCLLKKP